MEIADLNNTEAVPGGWERWQCNRPFPFPEPERVIPFDSQKPGVTPGTNQVFLAQPMARSISDVCSVIPSGSRRRRRSIEQTGIPTNATTKTEQARSPDCPRTGPPLPPRGTPRPEPLREPRINDKCTFPTQLPCGRHDAHAVKQVGEVNNDAHVADRDQRCERQVKHHVRWPWKEWCPGRRPGRLREGPRCEEPRRCRRMRR